MTRMLCSLFLLVLMSCLTTSCTLFSSSNEEGTAAAAVESAEETVPADPLLDSEAIDSELDDLSDSQGFVDNENSAPVDPNQSQINAEPVDNFDDFNSENISDPLNEENFADEFQAAEFDSNSASTQESFALSETNESQVDPLLATDELNNFSDPENQADQFVLDAEPLSEEIAQQPAVQEDPLQDPDFMSVEQETPAVATSVETLSGNQITNLGYKAYENGGTVVIDTATPAIFDVNNDKNLNQIVVQIEDVFLPQRFKRPYITKDFRQDIATINAYQEEGSSSAKVVIQMKRPVEPVIQNEGNSILVMTTEGGGAPALADNSNPEQPLNDLVSENQMNMSAQAMNPDQDEMSLEMNSAQPANLMSSESSNSNNYDSNSANVRTSDKNEPLDGPSYSGEKISLEFVDTDIRYIIEVIADKSGVNLIMDKEVTGPTTIRLRNVPWDQALVVLLRSQSLGYVKQGNVLRIAKQETLSKEAADLSAQIKSEKEAQLYSKGIKVKYIPVSYAKVDTLATKLKEFISKEGKITSDDRTSSLVITDFPDYIERVQELVKALDTPPMQVEIAAKLVEAREEFSREAGINWNTTGSPFSVGGSRTGQINSSLPGGPGSGFSLDLSVGTFDIFGDLSASLGLFEQQNKVKVLSQPRIVTMNKTKASIKQTTQIPIETVLPQVGVGAAPIPNITYQDLTLSLDVTPQITFKGDVILEVELKREFPGGEASNGQIEINRRNAKTTIMVRSGKTAVIGGIYQLDDIDRDSGIPWLKDIPLIGYLFKQVSTLKNKNELLLFLKPKILKDVEGTTMEQAKAPPLDSLDAFEELSIDEGSFNSSEEGAIKSDSFGDDNSFDDPVFESEVF